MITGSNLLSGAVAAVFCGAVAWTALLQATAQPAIVSRPSADAQTLQILNGATAFLATLSKAQKGRVIYDFTDRGQLANWSNLPEGAVCLGGLRWGELDTANV